MVNKIDSNQISFEQNLMVFSKGIPNCTRMIKGLKALRIFIIGSFILLMIVEFYSLEDLSAQSMAEFDPHEYLMLGVLMMILSTTYVITGFRRTRNELEAFKATCERILQSDKFDGYDNHLQQMSEYKKYLRRPIQLMFKSPKLEP